MKITGKQFISGFFIVGGMIYMQFHSINLWKTMIPNSEWWEAIVPSVMIDLIATWAWFYAKFTKETWHKALGFLVVAMTASTIVIITATMDVSFNVSEDKQLIEKADGIIKRNNEILKAQTLTLKKASEWGDHKAVAKAQRSIREAEQKIEEAYKLKGSKDTDIRLEMKSWIMAITITIILIAQIICAHTIRPETKKKAPQINSTEGGNNEIEEKEQEPVVPEEEIKVPEQKEHSKEPSIEQAKAQELYNRLEAIGIKNNGESIGTVLSTRVKHSMEDGTKRFYRRNIKNKLEDVIVSNKGLSMEKLISLEEDIAKIE